MFMKVCLLAVAVAMISCAAMPRVHADTNIRQPSASDLSKSPNMSEPVSQITNKSPIEVVANAKVGTLHNPYTGKPDMIAEGKKVFSGAGCPGCHGGGGGGGMCPSLKNNIWVYGSDDDTLFRLITLGSIGLQAKGYVRQGMENVVAPMPPFGEILKTDADVFKAVAYIHSLYDVSKGRVNW
jgi:mono/diheme cytochrome c family protein